MATRKKKCDCTPEEWEEFLSYQRAYRKTHAKHKEDYTEEEWAEKLKKQREYERKYREKDRESYNAKKRIGNLTEEQREKRRTYQKKYREEHRDSGRASARKYYNKNKDAISKRRKEQRIENHEKIIAKERELYLKNRERKIKWNKEYRKTHKIVKKPRTDEQRKKEREYARYKRMRNPEKYKEYAKKYKQRKVKYIDWFEKLSIDEKPIQDKDGYLMCIDYYTKEYFYPTRGQVESRVLTLSGKRGGGNHLYSSEESKQKCLVFHQVKHPKDNKPYRISHTADSRQKLWRDMVISRADGHCERCGKECDSLIAHHKVPVASCAMMAADIDNGMALCHECHKEVHSTDGCRLHELAAEKREAS